MCLKNKQSFDTLNEAYKECVKNDIKIESGFFKSFRWIGTNRSKLTPQMKFNEENLYKENYISYFVGEDEHYYFDFKNGARISVIRNMYSWGGSRGLFEMALQDNDGWFDPMGYLTDKQVNKILKKIAKMDKVGEKEWELICWTKPKYKKLSKKIKRLWQK